MKRILIGYALWSGGMVGTGLAVSGHGVSAWAMLWFAIAIFGLVGLVYQSGMEKRTTEINREISRLVMDGHAQMNLLSVRGHLRDRGLL